MSTTEPITLDPTGADPHAEAAALRAHGPATPVALPGGVRAWAVTSYDLLCQLTTDPRVSTDAFQHWPAWRDGHIPADWPLNIWIAVRNMFTAHGRDHKRLRSLVSSAFTARRTAALRPRVEQLTTSLLDALDTLPPHQPVDLRAEFAYPLPIEVICQLFGVPDAMRADLRDLVGRVFHTAATAEEAQANGLALYTRLGELVAVKRADPADDLTSALIAARDDETGEVDQLTETELIDTLLLMLGGGHQTTVDLLDHAVTALCTHRDQLALVLGGQRSWSDAIEETLRWQGPLAYLPLRYAITDIPVGEVVIEQGDPILIGYAAAGRDPARFGANADEFDITRADKQHVAFGHGAHHCLGAPLARLEAEVALPALFIRFPELTLALPAYELTGIPSFISNGHTSLPVFLQGES